MPGCAGFRYVAGTQWGNKKYMKMMHLEVNEKSHHRRLISLNQRRQTNLRINLDGTNDSLHMLYYHRS